MDCREILASPGGRRGEIELIYLHVGHQWYRMFLDEKVLFLDEVDAPDAEEDLPEGVSDYTPIGGKVHGRRITSCVFHNGAFRMDFADNTPLLLEERDGGTFVSQAPQ